MEAEYDAERQGMVCQQYLAKLLKQKDELERLQTILSHVISMRVIDADVVWR